MNKLQITLLSLLGIVTACTNDTDENITGNTGRAVIVQGSIGTAQVERAATGEGGISYQNSFDKDDKIGLFATGGLTASNEMLTHNDNVFKSDNLNWTGGNASAVWAYFPYSKNKVTDGTIKINIWKDAKGPIPAGFDDILVAKPGNINEGTIINATFEHRFALLCVKRGKGFSNAKDGHKTVKVSLTQSISSNATINYNNDKDFVALDDDDTNTGHKELETNATNDGYYAIIPVGKVGDGDFLNIESITLYNDLNREMTVPYSIKSLESGKIFTVTVIMRDNEAVVSPTEIVQWDNENVNIEELAGIKDATQFKAWVGAYNDQGAEGSEGILKKCGSYSTTDGKWTFRLLNDITLTADDNISGITSFSDIFDGQGHTITGINIHEEEKGTSPAGFVRTLNGGSIERLILKDAVIYGNDNVGGFAGTAKSGSTIKDCKLTGASIIFGKSNVGAFVGKNESATVTNCTYSPTVIVKATN